MAGRAAEENNNSVACWPLMVVEEGRIPAEFCAAVRS